MMFLLWRRAHFDVPVSLGRPISKIMFCWEAHFGRMCSVGVVTSGGFFSRCNKSFPPI